MDVVGETEAVDKAGVSTFRSLLDQLESYQLCNYWELVLKSMVLRLLSVALKMCHLFKREKICKYWYIYISAKARVKEPQCFQARIRSNLKLLG